MSRAMQFVSSRERGQDRIWGQTVDMGRLLAHRRPRRVSPEVQIAEVTPLTTLKEGMESSSAKCVHGGLQGTLRPVSEKITY